MTNHKTGSDVSLDALLTRLAKEHLNIETLVVRHMDRLDFYDVSVWSVKSALKEAYLAGMANALATSRDEP